MSSKPQNMNDTQLRMRAIAAPKQELGVAGTLCFLPTIHQKPTDYIEISHQRYANQSLDEIFTRAQENWQG
jgi:hypothetical protein